MSYRILVVDDEESIRFTFSAFLCDAGYSVETAESLEEALDKRQRLEQKIRARQIEVLKRQFGCSE